MADNAEQPTQEIITDPQQKLEVIESYWYREAQAFKAAKGLGARALAAERCDMLLDEADTIKRLHGLGKYAVGS